MSTASVTLCPPSKHDFGHGGSAPCFDRHQFAGRPSRAVAATLRHDGTYDTPGIAFADLSSMHVQRTVKQQIRRLPTPEWAKTNEGMRNIVLRALESRYYIRDVSGTDGERIKRIDSVARAGVPRLRVKLERLLRRYHELATNGASEEKKCGVAIEVGNLDTQIMMAERGVTALVCSALYLYFRLGWDSVSVAEQLGLKSPQIRIWFYRIHRLANGERRQRTQRSNITPSSCQRERRRKWTPERVDQLRRLRDQDKLPWSAVARMMGCNCANTVSAAYRNHRQ